MYGNTAKLVKIGTDSPDIYYNCHQNLKVSGVRGAAIRAAVDAINAAEGHREEEGLALIAGAVAAVAILVVVLALVGNVIAPERRHLLVIRITQVDGGLHQLILSFSN